MSTTRTAALLLASTLLFSACGADTADNSQDQQSPESLVMDADETVASTADASPSETATTAALPTTIPATTAAPTTAAPTTAAPTTAAPTTAAPTTVPLTIFGTVGLPEYGVTCGDIDPRAVDLLNGFFNYGDTYEAVIGDGFAGDDIRLFASIPGEGYVASSVVIDDQMDYMIVLRFDREPVVLARGEDGFDALYAATEGRFGEETIGLTEVSFGRTNVTFGNCQEWELGPIFGGGM